MTVNEIKFPPVTRRLIVEANLAALIDNAEAHAAVLKIARPALEALDLIEVANFLAKFADDFDGAPVDNESTGQSFRLAAAAEAVAALITTGMIVRGDWCQFHVTEAPQQEAVAWLRDQMEDAEDQHHMFALAARLLACRECEGHGVLAVNTHGTGEDAVEVECDTCSGTGCGDCATVDEDDERGPRGMR